MGKPRGEYTTKQVKFCQKYIETGNSTEAAIFAGYSKKTAHSQGSRLLENVKIKAYLESIWNKAAEKEGITATKIIDELAKIGFSDIKNYLKYNNRAIVLIDSNKLTQVQSGAISEIKMTETAYGRNVSLKLYNKVEALEKIAKMMGLITEKHDHTTKGESINPLTAIPIVITTKDQLDKLGNEETNKEKDA